SNASAERTSTAPSTPIPPAFETSTTTSRQWEKANSGNSMLNFSQMTDFMVFLDVSCSFRVASGSGARSKMGDHHRPDRRQIGLRVRTALDRCRDHVPRRLVGRQPSLDVLDHLPHIDRGALVPRYACDDRL